MQINYSDIPQWLQDSHFYQNLGSDEVDGFIEIPAECYRETSEHVRTADDLEDILRVMRFWMVNQIPQSVLNFCHAHQSFEWSPVFVEIVGDGSPELNTVSLACQRSDKFSLSTALASHRPELVTFWMSMNLTCSEENKNSMVQACRFGRLDLVETLFERGFPYHAQAFCAAAQYGQLDVLHYLHERGIPCEERAQVFAARGGHLDCMKHLHSIGCSFVADMTKEFAVPAHYLYLKKHYPSAGIMWADGFSLIPPAGDYLGCLRFALSNGCPVHMFATHAAARYGLLDCLQLLHQYQAEWDAETFANAAEGGHLDCLVYLQDHGCPTRAGAVYSAAAHGHIHCLQYLHHLNLTRDFAAASFAATHGHLACLQWLHENGYAWNHSATAGAATRGNLECLMYLHTNGCAWTENACEHAAEGGHLSCLQYLHENGCPWDKRATTAAARFNHLACLQYLHIHGCEWDTTTTTNAAINGHVECLRYAVEHGCPYNLQYIVNATAGENVTSSCVKYLLER